MDNKTEALGLIFDAERALDFIRKSFGNDVEVASLIEKAGVYLNSLWLKVEAQDSSEYTTA